MESADWHEVFEHILRDFKMCRAEARSAAGPGDVFERIAALGFARVAPDRQWGPAQAAIIRKLREGDYSDEVLQFYEDGREPVALFACLCYGALLGLDADGRLQERDRAMGEAILPGFIISKLSDVEA
jgi:hypothetical protein